MIFSNCYINPFTRIAGIEAFSLGLFIVLLTALTGAYGNVYFDGVLDFHFVGEVTISNSLLISAINIVSITLVMYVAGLFISKGFRFIDILGTMTLARAPFLILALLSLITESPDLKEVFVNPFVLFSSTSFLFVMFLAFPILIWYITLMYNALKISCDAKGSKLTIVFMLALFVAEIVSKLLIYIIIK